MRKAFFNNLFLSPYLPADKARNERLPDDAISLGESQLTSMEKHSNDLLEQEKERREKESDLLRRLLSSGNLSELEAVLEERIGMSYLSGIKRVRVVIPRRHERTPKELGFRGGGSNITSEVASPMLGLKQTSKIELMDNHEYSKADINMNK